jgi:citrate lyase subunit beta/citryl-CoA lyase
LSASAISYLFVPATRPERFEKAFSSDSDAVIIDLEDAVAVEEKDAALGHLLVALEAGLSQPVHVRINAADSPWFDRDLDAVAGLSDNAAASLAGVILPKAERPEDLARVSTALSARQQEIVALIESAAGVARIRELAGSAGLTRFAVGAADLSFDLDVAISSPTVDWVYAQLVVESRLAGLPGPLASPPFEIRDLATVEHEARRLKALGAAGQLCIHPAQVHPIHRGFLPEAETIAWAQRVVDTNVTNGAGQVDGQMVDKPIRERAERVLAQSAR